MTDAVPGQTYQFDVEGIGTFTARRRTMRDSAAIPNHAISILGGWPGHPAILEQATRLAELEMLITRAPEEWDIQSLDPLDKDDQAKLDKVHGGLRDAEERFRRELKERRSTLGRSA